MNFGHSSRLPYDEQTYNDQLQESVGPLNYRLNPDQISNCNRCLSTFGPRSSHGVSTGSNSHVAPSQNLVDLESVLSNRNVRLSKCKDCQVNNNDLSEFATEPVSLCDNEMDPISSRLTNPVANYRGMSINRFIDHNKNPQDTIFWNFAVNTQLQARDNYSPNIPSVKDSDETLPVATDQKNCQYSCYSANCPNDCSCKYAQTQ